MMRVDFSGPDSIVLANWTIQHDFCRNILQKVLSIKIISTDTQEIPQSRSKAFQEHQKKDRRETNNGNTNAMDFSSPKMAFRLIKYVFLGEGECYGLSLLPSNICLGIFCIACTHIYLV